MAAAALSAVTLKRPVISVFCRFLTAVFPPNAGNQRESFLRDEFSSARFLSVFPLAAIFIVPENPVQKIWESVISGEKASLPQSPSPLPQSFLDALSLSSSSLFLSSSSVSLSSSSLFLCCAALWVSLVSSADDRQRGGSASAGLDSSALDRLGPLGLAAPPRCLGSSSSLRRLCQSGFVAASRRPPRFYPQSSGAPPVSFQSRARVERLKTRRVSASVEINISHRMRSAQWKPERQKTFGRGRGRSSDDVSLGRTQTLKCVNPVRAAAAAAAAASNGNGNVEFKCAALCFPWSRRSAFILECRLNISASVHSISTQHPTHVPTQRCWFLTAVNNYSVYIF
ncbi:uncharacterized protein V6R79_016944 [Siganus canaliculatus]